MAYKDLRDFLRIAGLCGELKEVRGVDWNLDMGSFSEIVYQSARDPKPALLFDDIPGYPRGFRCLFGQISSPRRIAMALGLPEGDGQLERRTLLGNLRRKLKQTSLVPPRFVAAPPVSENTVTGGAVDVLKFPAPKFHELDGGRYIGTGCTVINRDPDTGFANLGTYRVMVVDRNRLAVHILPGKHGSVLMNEKYFARGKPRPIAVAIGIDPALWFASNRKIPWQTSEYDYAGLIKGEPIEVFEGAHTGLPLPATAEIVIEGECHPGELAEEGPFGEGVGYYANLGLEKVPEPVIRVKAIHWRDDPILTCSNPAVPPSEASLMFAYSSSAMLWEKLEAAGIPGIKDVWCPEVGHGCMLNVVSIEQKYAGHSTETGVFASQIHDGGGVGKYTIVVDDDIDPSDMNQVLWAVESRTDPARSIQFIDRCHTTSRDPSVSMGEKRNNKSLLVSRCIIDACQPFDWGRENWFPVARSSQEQRAKIFSKYGTALRELL
ncbi:MAG: UbiD family decarboxylase [Betaproteobacteria bacterium]|nr:UbiD family decarboxylase [Betaproteobacteria bacterium]